MGEKVIRLLAGLLAAIIVLVVAFPFFVMLSVSLQTKSELFSTSANLIPRSWAFSNYAEAMRCGSWGRYFLNSFVVAGIVVCVSLVINAMAGYVFARLKFRFARPLFILILAGMMIPPQVTMIPVFSMLRGVPLVNGNDWLGSGGSGHLILQISQRLFLGLQLGHDLRGLLGQLGGAAQLEVPPMPLSLWTASLAARVPSPWPAVRKP